MGLGIKPNPDRILVEIEKETEHVSPSGIIVTAPEKHAKPKEGWIYAIGSRIKEDDLEIGDRVLFTEPDPRGFKHDGRSLLSLRPEQIQGRFIDEK